MDHTVRHGLHLHFHQSSKYIRGSYKVQAIEIKGIAQQDQVKVKILLPARIPTQLNELRH